MAVAEHDSSIISKALVEDLVDKQINSCACRTFSVEVEETQRKLGFIREADFTCLLKSWYQAKHARGIPAQQRTQRRLNLRKWLLDGVNLSSFLPYGSHIKGFPQIMFEVIFRVSTHTCSYMRCAEL